MSLVMWYQTITVLFRTPPPPAHLLDLHSSLLIYTLADSLMMVKNAADLTKYFLFALLL